MSPAATALNAVAAKELPQVMRKAVMFAAVPTRSARKDDLLMIVSPHRAAVPATTIVRLLTPRLLPMHRGPRSRKNRKVDVCRLPDFDLYGLVLKIAMRGLVRVQKPPWGQVRSNVHIARKLTWGDCRDVGFP